MELKVKKITPDAVMPEFKTAGAVAADLCANETVTAYPGKATLIPLGIAVEIPDEHVLILASRSSLPLKKGLFVCNGIGLIDSDYTGELKLLVAPIGNESVVVEKGERIAQMMLQPCKHVYNPGIVIDSIIEVDQLKITDRNPAGFGTTGH